jgi:hypothetical protein
MTKDPQLKDFLRERDRLFRKPTLKAAQDWWVKNDYPKWHKYDVPLAAVHKGRLQWLEATDQMLIDSQAWLLANGYEADLQGAPPLTPERRDADRVALGKKPLGES